MSSEEENGLGVNLAEEIQANDKSLPAVDSYQSKNLYSTFLDRFTNKDFFIKLLNLSLYQADFDSVATTKNSEVVKFFRHFLNDIQKDVQEYDVINLPKKTVISLARTIKSILDIREDPTSKLLSYDSVFSHFPNAEGQMLRYFEEVSENRIETIQEFRNLYDEVVKYIQAYNELKNIKSVVNQLDGLKNKTDYEDSSILGVLKEYKETIYEAHATLSQLQTIEKDENLADYLVFSNKDSVVNAVDHITTFLTDSYNLYNSGYAVLDDYVDGIESSSVHTIVGPSNHGKSIFMLNLARNMIEQNEPDFNFDEDVFVFITLEDDINKLLKRIISVFGNYNSRVVKKLFKKASDILKNQKNKDISNTKSSTKINNYLNELLGESIIKITDGRCSFVIKHNEENQFSMADATQFIDKMEMEGKRVRSMFIDYID